jgi:hypothetical protein
MILKLFEVEIEGAIKHMISFIQHEEAFENGINNKGVVGYLKDPNAPILHENITYNPDFIYLFHKTVKETSVHSKQLSEAALKQNTGYIYIIDLRDKNRPNTKPQDIIGAFKLEEGNIIEDSYSPNPNYQLISEDGAFKLPDDFIQNLEIAMFE